jgi:hypothetical protein
MNQLFLVMLFFTPPQEETSEARVQALIAEISQSGRVLEIDETRNRLSDPRREIAPGAPPLLAFRYFQGADRHRFGKLDLMLDDAGH